MSFGVGQAKDSPNEPRRLGIVEHWLPEESLDFLSALIGCSSRFVVPQIDRHHSVVHLRKEILQARELGVAVLRPPESLLIYVSQVLGVFILPCVRWVL